MSKHRRVTKWVAHLYEPWDHGSKEVQSFQVEVIETPKQYRLVDDDEKAYRRAYKACGWRRVLNKGDSMCPIFDTEGEALNALDTYWVHKERNASRAAEVAQENLFLTTEAIRDYNKRTP